MRRIFSPVRAALLVSLCALAAAESGVSTPLSTPEEARAVAAQLADSGNQPAAIAILQDELAKHPADTVTRLQLARHLALSKHYTEANQHYAAVLAREPQNLAAKVGLAKVASWQSDLDRSLALYDEVLARSPHLYDARVGKGFTLAWMGRHEEALTILRAAAKVHPEDQEVAAELARLAKLVRSSEPAAIVTSSHKPPPRRDSTIASVAPATDYPRTFAEPISPAAPLVPEPRPWIPIGAFATVVLALAGVTYAVRKRIPGTIVPTAVPPAATASAPVVQRTPVVAGPEPEIAPEPAPARVTRVLLVEANDDAAEFVRMVLTQHGAHVERLSALHEVLTHPSPVDLVILGEACAPARAEEFMRIAERAGSALVFACNTPEEAQAIHSLGGQSIRRPFRIMDLFALLVPATIAGPSAEPPIDAHTWQPSQADAASCERPFHSPPRPLQ